MGLIPSREERESFWLSPTHLETEHQDQGELFDSIFEENLLKMSDLKERAIKFMMKENSESIDFQNFLNATNSLLFLNWCNLII